MGEKEGHYGLREMAERLSENLKTGRRQQGERVTRIPVSRYLDPAWFARDSLSRGWDYAGISWRRAWTDNFATVLRTRHYFSDSPLQGPPEEYNLWEDGGTKLRPRMRIA